MWIYVSKKFSLYESPPPVGDPADPASPEGGGVAPVVPPVPVSDVAQIPVDVLPEDLQGLPAGEIKFHLSRMVDGLRQNNEKTRDLEDQVRQLRATPPPPAEPPKPVRPLEEMILDDPEAAIMEVMERRGLTTRFDRIESQAGESAFNIVASKVPGFDEHEADVRKIITDSGVPATPEHITGALEMVIGRKALADKGRAGRAAASPDIPVEDPPKPVKDITLTGLEKEIQESSGMSPEEYTKYKDTQNFEIKVPTS